MLINRSLLVTELRKKVDRLWECSADKIALIRREYDHSHGSPVFTVSGKYSTRGWTEWTQGFEFGSAILQFDATGNSEFLQYGRKATVEKMAEHVGHFGAHDHGFNNVSTYGNLLRLMREGKIEANEWERLFYELALKLSGAVQAKRWTNIKDGGFIYSFNGPHSLFVDTIRTVRALIVSHELGYALMGERDARTSLLERAVLHAKATAKYSIYYGEGRDSYDIWGRTAHESIFNTNDGNYRCPNSQQGYTGFSTWTRGLAWAMSGFSEQLEYIDTLHDSELAPYGGKEEITDVFLKAAKATCDFYIDHTPSDGIPYWDTAAPNLHKMGDYLSKPADPYNVYEPVDSSAAAIAAQGLLRLGHYLKHIDSEASAKYWQAGLTVLDALFDKPYLSNDPSHQGLIAHSVYHQPNGWDYIHPGGKVPYGESSMWGDYHAREIALYVKRIIENGNYYTFYSCVK